MNLEAHLCMSSSGRKLTALVTGASGFVGRNLVSRLLMDGWNVAAVLRGSSRLPCGYGFEKLVSYRDEGTIEDLSKFIGNTRPDVVYHLASLFIAEHSTRDVEPLVMSNVLFGARLLEAMKNSETRVIINAGTSWQNFGMSGVYRPACLYAATKEAFEALLTFYVDAHNFRSITLKLSDTYGPNDPRPKLVPLLISALSSGKTLSMSPGEQLIDLVHIDDVVNAFIQAPTVLSNRLESYSVFSGLPIRLREFVQLFSEIAGKDILVEWGARPYRAREVMVPSFGRALPGWKPQVELSLGLRQVLKDANALF